MHLDENAALFYAARYGHLQTATLLLDRGADPNAHAPWRGSALKAARDHGHHELAALLLARGATA